MIKVTIRKMLRSTEAIAILKGQKLPLKASYAVGKLATAVENETTAYTKARDKVFEEAGATIVDFQWHHDDKEVFDGLKKQVEELQDQEVELNALPLDLDQFGSVELPGGAFAGLTDWAMKEGST